MDHNNIGTKIVTSQIAGIHNGWIELIMNSVLVVILFIVSVEVENIYITSTLMCMCYLWQRFVLFYVKKINFMEESN